MLISFLHPDLGIGGAERLAVDAAIALQEKGHTVKIYTSHHDKNHCFPETKDGTLDVCVVGDWLPRSMFGKFNAFFAYMRMIIVALYVLLKVPTDVAFCDQVSACIPFLKLKQIKVLFYCHFPDLLLTERKSFGKKAYRYCLDWVEEFTTGMADVILVNSEFTGSVFRRTFKSLCNKELDVLHPAVKFDVPDDVERVSTDYTYFLSLNRYEMKKNIGLAILALDKLRKVLPSSQVSKCRLVIAGGYDNRVAENERCFLQLQSLAESCDVHQITTFLRSPSDSEKQKLFSQATAVLYTPENEHFGIVPLEAMIHCKPVIACNSGGPMETIDNGITGFLCDPTPDAFAEKMSLLVSNKKLVKEMGLAGAKRVSEKFSFQAFSEKLNNIVINLNK